MIRRLHCFVVECDDCRVAFGEDEADGYTLHFTTDQEALDHLAASAWTLSSPGRLHCGSCTAVHLCVDLGHDWGPWKVCACHGHIPAHDTNGCGLFRVCHRCAISEDATLANLPTTDQPSSGR